MYSALYVNTNHDITTFKVDGLKYRELNVSRMEHDSSLK